MLSPSAIQCPNCGASVPVSTQTCPACGFPLADIAAQVTRNPETARQLAEELNQELVKSATNAAELAFGVSCTLGAILIGLLLVVVYFAISKALTVVFVAAFLAILIGTVVAALLATRAKNATLENAYQRVSEPRIKEYLRYSGMTREEFSGLAAGTLPEGAPLLVYLPTKPVPDRSEG